MSVRQDEWETIKGFLEKPNFSVPEIGRRVGRSATTIYNLIKNGGPKEKKRRKESISKKLIAYTSYLDKRISLGVTNAYKLFSDIKNQGYNGSYILVNEYVKNTRVSENKRDYRQIKHSDAKPGQQAQVDWGSCGKVIINDREEKLYCFVYVLSYSRAMYLEFTTKQNLQNFEQCHVNAFKALGIPQTIVYDNVKTVVIGREKVDGGKQKIRYNLNFLDFSKHYGFNIWACTPHKPWAKGKVESGVKYVKNNFLQGISTKGNLESLKEINERAREWIKNVANERIHGTTKQRPLDLWTKEKPFLKSEEDYPTYCISPYLERFSTHDALVQYKSVFYQIHYKYARKKVYVRESTKNGLTYLNIYYEDKLISVYELSSEKGKIISHGEDFVFHKSAQKYKKLKIKSTSLSRMNRNFLRPLSYYNQLSK